MSDQAGSRITDHGSTTPDPRCRDAAGLARGFLGFALALVMLSDWEDGLDPEGRTAVAISWDARAESIKQMTDLGWLSRWAQ